VFNTLFRAIVELLQSSMKKEMTVTTDCYNDHDVVEIQFPQSDSLESSIIKVVDPLFRRGGWMAKKQKEMGVRVYQEFLKSVGGEFEVISKNGKGTVVKIKIPAAQAGQAESQKQEMKKDEASSVIM
jgi:sensor histidine kinase regulating citrate/malate metabolism